SAGSNICHPKNLKPWLRREVKSQHLVSGAGPVTVKEIDTSSSSLASGKNDDTYTLPRMDKNGRFCSPRAARELALLIVYASCLDGHNPVRLFEKRMNAPRESRYVFNKNSLLQYDHTRFGGPPVITSSVEEADQHLSELEAESAIEAEVLSAPLRFTKKLLGAVVDNWDNHVLVIDKVAPSNWKNEPAGRILEFSILHLAMSEISAVGTRHQIVINEAVDLAKRFCDGSAPRIINGCLRTFVQEQS
uniref:NusB/RsmB/TIM44 domain-containing protein n=1 Tax=Chenopodium quinoa TaxID=63459 RepID=A0A803LEE2_CHEQI